MKAELLDFYAGTTADHRGRMLVDILKQSDDWLEQTHDFIQWLFPLETASAFDPAAPTLDVETQRYFAADERLRMHLRLSFMRMLRFYGLRPTPLGIVRAENWDDRKHDWFDRDTHNNRRITRIIRSLSLLGMHREAVVLQHALEQLCDSEADCGIGDEARRYWRNAIQRSNSTPRS